MFNNILYKQKDGVALRSPLGQQLEIFFLLFYELKWLEQCPSELKPVFCRRFVDDMFVLFKSGKYFSKFHAYLNI